MFQKFYHITDTGPRVPRCAACPGSGSMRCWVDSAATPKRTAVVAGSSNSRCLFCAAARDSLIVSSHCCGRSLSTAPLRYCTSP